MNHFLVLINRIVNSYIVVELVCLHKLMQFKLMLVATACACTCSMM